MPPQKLISAVPPEMHVPLMTESRSQSKIVSLSKMNAAPALPKSWKTSNPSTIPLPLQISEKPVSFPSEEPTWTNLPWVPPAKTPLIRRPATPGTLTVSPAVLPAVPLLVSPLMKSPLHWVPIQAEVSVSPQPIAALSDSNPPTEESPVSDSWRLHPLLTRSDLSPRM